VKIVLAASALVHQVKADAQNILFAIVRASMAITTSY
jgi:hypothetical protein